MALHAVPITHREQARVLCELIENEVAVLVDLGSFVWVLSGLGLAHDNIDEFVLFYCHVLVDAHGFLLELDGGLPGVGFELLLDLLAGNRLTWRVVRESAVVDDGESFLVAGLLDLLGGLEVVLGPDWLELGQLDICGRLLLEALVDLLVDLEFALDAVVGGARHGDLVLLRALDLASRERDGLPARVP